MPRALFVWLVLGLWLTGCGGWPYGGENPPSGLIEPEAKIADPEPTGPSCTQRRVAVSLLEETAAGIPNDVAHWIEGFHTGSLIWSNGNRTTLTIEAWDLQAFFIESHARSDRVVDNNDITCATYLEIVAQVELSTSDGRIFLDSELTLRLYGSIEGFGTLRVPYDALDNYAPVATGRCFQGIDAKILLGDTGFSGSLSNDFTQGACENTTDLHVPAPAGHWGRRWQSY